MCVHAYALVHVRERGRGREADSLLSTEPNLAHAGLSLKTRS